MDPLAKRNIETMINLTKKPADRIKTRAKVDRYIDLIGEHEEEYAKFANEHMAKQWRE